MRMLTAYTINKCILQISKASASGLDPEVKPTLKRVLYIRYTVQFI